MEIVAVLAFIAVLAGLILWVRRNDDADVSTGGGGGGPFEPRLPENDNK